MTRSIPRALSTTLACFVACGNPAPNLVSFPILVEARSTDDETLLSGVTVERTRGSNAAENLGATSAEGTLAHTFQLPAGTPIQLAAHCPLGFQLGAPMSPMVVFPLVQGAATQVRTRVACAPEKRSLVIVVRAIIEHGLDRLEPAPGLAIAVDGTDRAHTSASGIAHILLEAAPRTSFRLRLSTTNTNLRPENPERIFVIPDTSDYLVFEQRFEPRAIPATAPPRRNTHRRVVAPHRTIPVRIP